MTTESARNLACPVCGARLRVEAKKGVAIDVCDEHGMWLDQGELDTVILKLQARMGRRHRRRVASARREGKMAGSVFGWWSLLFD